MATDNKSRVMLVIYVVLAFALGYLFPHNLEEAADQKPQEMLGLYSFEKKNVQKAEKLYEALPPRVKAALVGSRMGLIFQADGGDAFQDNEKYSSDEKLQYYAVVRKALYIDFEGNAHLFYDAIQERDSTAGAKEKWIEMMQLIGATTDEAVFAALGDDVKKLAQQALQYHLKSLSRESCDAWLAEKCRLLYHPKGKNFFTGEVRRMRVAGTHREWVRRVVSNDALFIDSQGATRCFNDAYNRVESNPRERAAWKFASYCATLLEPEDVLALYPEKANAMRMLHTGTARRAK